MYTVGMEFPFTQDLVLLTAPPAAGKTYWISELQKTLSLQNVLVVSPLRALADECRKSWGARIEVKTPEEWLSKKSKHDVVIFDEFHLFFYWGDTFRPLMWEAFYELCLHSKMTFLLTATLSSEMRKEIMCFSQQFDRIFWVDQGNQTLRYKPTRYVRSYSRRWIENLIYVEEVNRSTKLIFCQYRKEVFWWEKKLKEEGFSVIGCVGGESRFMQDRLRQNPKPDFIISTTVLSHGVNLPVIEKIFFLYKLNNVDFWIQMVARGGRKGERYIVFGLDNPVGLKWNRYFNLFMLIGISISNCFKWKSLERNMRCFLNTSSLE